MKRKKEEEFVKETSSMPKVHVIPPKSKEPEEQ